MKLSIISIGIKQVPVKQGLTVNDKRCSNVFLFGHMLQLLQSQNVWVQNVQVQSFFVCWQQNLLLLGSIIYYYPCKR